MVSVRPMQRKSRHGSRLVDAAAPGLWRSAQDKIRICGTGFLLLLLVGALYGDIQERGGYADDFVYLNFESYPTIVDAVRGWDYNSRWTQALLVPLAFRAAVADSSQVHWWLLHGIAVLSLAAVAALLCACLRAARNSFLEAFLAAALFVVLPSNTQAVLWPAAALGYTVPTVLFLVGVLAVLVGRRRNRPAVGLVLATPFLWAAMLGVEQLALPVFAVYGAVLVWPTMKPGSRWVAGGVLGAAVTVFVFSVYGGATAERIERHGLAGGTKVWQRVAAVAEGATAGLVVRPSARLRDPYYADLVKEELQRPLFWLASGAWVTALVVLGIRGRCNRARRWSKRERIRWLGVGAMLCVAALAPLAAVDYGVPPRCLFVPGVGIALASAFAIAPYFHLPITKVLVAAAGLAGIAIIRIDAGQAASYWAAEKRVMDIAREAAVTHPSQVFLVGFPKSFGAVPSFANGFSLPGLVRWVGGVAASEASGDSTFLAAVTLSQRTRQNDAGLLEVRGRSRSLTILQAGERVFCLVGPGLATTGWSACDVVEKSLPLRPVGRAGTEAKATSIWQIGRGCGPLVLYTPKQSAGYAEYRGGWNVRLRSKDVDARVGASSVRLGADETLAEYYVADTRELVKLTVGNWTLNLEEQAGCQESDLLGAAVTRKARATN